MYSTFVFFSKIDKNATTDEICIEIISLKSVNLLALTFKRKSQGVLLATVITLNEDLSIYLPIRSPVC